MTSRQLDKMFKKFGERCKRLREQKGLTQEDMMTYGFSTRFYQRIEAGKPIHLKTVFKLASVFKIKTAEMFKDN